jgi:hypothetical protein
MSEKKKLFSIDIASDAFKQHIIHCEHYDRYNLDGLLPLLPDTIKGYSLSDKKKADLMTEEDVFLDPDERLQLSFNHANGTLLITDQETEKESFVLLAHCSFLPADARAGLKPLRVEVESEDLLKYDDDVLNHREKLTDSILAKIPDRIADWVLKDRDKDDLLYYGCVYIPSGNIAFDSATGYLSIYNDDTNENRLIRETECFFGPMVYRHLDKPQHLILQTKLKDTPPFALLHATFLNNSEPATLFNPADYTDSIPDIIGGTWLRQTDKVTLLVTGEVRLPGEKLLELDTWNNRLVCSQPHPEHADAILKEVVDVTQVTFAPNQRVPSDMLAYHYPVQEEQYREVVATYALNGNVTVAALDTMVTRLPNVLHGEHLGKEEQLQLFCEGKVVEKPGYSYLFHAQSGTLLCSETGKEDVPYRRPKVASVTTADCAFLAQAKKMKVQARASKNKGQEPNV